MPRPMSGRGHREGKEPKSRSPTPPGRVEEQHEQGIEPSSDPREGSIRDGPYRASARVMDNMCFFNLILRTLRINAWHGLDNPGMACPPRMHLFSSLSLTDVEHMRVATRMSMVCKTWHALIKGMIPSAAGPGDVSGQVRINLLPFDWFRRANEQLMAMMRPGPMGFRPVHGSAQGRFQTAWLRHGNDVQTSPLACAELDGYTVERWSGPVAMYVQAARQSNRMTEAGVNSFRLKTWRLVRRYDLNLRILSGVLYYVVFAMAGLHLRSAEQQDMMRNWIWALLDQLQRYGDQTPQYHDIINALFTRLLMICDRHVALRTSQHERLNLPYDRLAAVIQGVATNACRPPVGGTNDLAANPFELNQTMVIPSQRTTYTHEMDIATPFGVAVRNAMLYVQPVTGRLVLNIEVYLTALLGTTQWYRDQFERMAALASVRALLGRLPVVSVPANLVFHGEYNRQWHYHGDQEDAAALPVSLIRPNAGMQEVLWADSLWQNLMFNLAGDHVVVVENEEGGMEDMLGW